MTYLLRASPLLGLYRHRHLILTTYLAGGHSWSPPFFQSQISDSRLHSLGKPWGQICIQTQIEHPSVGKRGVDGLAGH